MNREATAGEFGEDQLLVARHFKATSPAHLLRNGDITRPLGNVLGQVGGAAGVASGAAVLNVNVHILIF